MKNKNHSEAPSRRRILKTIAAGGGAVVAGKTLPQSWYKPVVETVVLPAHAQTSGCGEATFIRATSPVGENGNTLRQILIVDESDDVLASCCCGDDNDIVIEVSSLPAGVYGIFGDSDGDLDHTVRITTECGTTTVSAPTDEGGCRFLIATVTLPDGIVVQENGQTVGGNKCVGNTNCLEGNT